MNAKMSITTFMNKWDVDQNGQVEADEVASPSTFKQDFYALGRGPEEIKQWGATDLQEWVADRFVADDAQRFLPDLGP